MRKDVYRCFSRLFLISLAAIFPLVGMAQQGKVPQPFHEPSSSETTVSDLSWQLPETMPKSVTQSKVVKRWIKDMYDYPPAWFAEIDIDHDPKTKEILIASRFGGSGGRSFLLIQQMKDGTWNKLLAMHGAPIFTGMQSGKFVSIQVIFRGEGMWLQNYTYKNGYYQFRQETRIPDVLSRDIYFDVSWKKLNLFEGDYPECRNNESSEEIKMMRNHLKK